MNFSFYTKKIFPFLLAIFGFGLVAFGQGTPTLEVNRVTVLKDGSYSHAFIQNNNTAAPQILQDAADGDGYFNPSWCCNGNQGVKGFNKPNNFYYEPDPNFTGRDTVIFLYHILGPAGTPRAAYKIFYFKVVPSFLKANDDFVATTQGQQNFQITVLANDEGNGTGQKISEVTNINNGTATLNADSTKVVFTPTTGFTGIANLNYSICDDQGSCSFAVVNICVNPTTPVAHEVLQLTTNKNKPVLSMLDINSSYSLTTPPAHGSLSGTFPLTYTPNQNYVGNDTYVYTSTNGNTRTVNIKVVNVPVPSEILNNDIVYTPKGVTIDEIHLLDNDNGGQYYGVVNAVNTVTQEGGVLTHLPSVGKGVYRYVPPVNFVGIDRFEYKAQPPNSNNYEFATCYIVVSDHDPVLSVYQITSPKNTPLVLGDHLPFDGYSYEAISTPDKGEIDFFPGQQTYTSQHGQSFSGKNMLVYDPDPNALGYDEFEFEYCADGIPGGCKLVKVELTLVDVANPQSPVLCAGRECVWAGDTNRDGAVNVVDVLPIGLCMGDVGLTRANGSNAWYGQTADDWNSFMADGLGYDVKYLDSDGNGIVSADDTTAIRMNYGYYHNLTPGPIAEFEPLPFYIQEPNFPQNLEIGDVFYATIGLGTQSVPAVNAYGLAFELLYDPAIFEVNILFQDNSWMDYNSPTLSMSHKPVLGKIDAAFTRTSGLAASGFGNIGVAEFIVIDDLAGVRLKEADKTLISLNGLGYMSGTGQVAGLKGTGFEVRLGGGSEEGIATEEQLIVFPNPASEAVTLHLNGSENQMERVMVYSMTGSLVYDSGKMTSKRMMVDVSGFVPGVYTVRVLANGAMLNKKIEVIR